MNDEKTLPMTAAAAAHVSHVVTIKNVAAEVVNSMCWCTVVLPVSVWLELFVVSLLFVVRYSSVCSAAAGTTTVAQR